MCISPRPRTVKVDRVVFFFQVSTSSNVQNLIFKFRGAFTLTLPFGFFHLFLVEQSVCTRLLMGLFFDVNVEKKSEGRGADAKKFICRYLSMFNLLFILT